jgi:hypothetical protein
MTFQIWGRLEADTKPRECCAGTDESRMRAVFETLKLAGSYEEIELRQEGLPAPLLRWRRPLRAAS